MIFLALFFAAYRYGYADHSFGFMQFCAHERGFIVPLPASVVKEASSVGISRFIMLCVSDSVLSLLA